MNVTFSLYVTLKNLRFHEFSLPFQACVQIMFKKIRIIFSKCPISFPFPKVTGVSNEFEINLEAESVPHRPDSKLFSSGIIIIAIMTVELRYYRMRMGKLHPLNLKFSHVAKRLSRTRWQCNSHYPQRILTRHPAVDPSSCCILIF